MSTMSGAPAGGITALLAGVPGPGGRAVELSSRDRSRGLAHEELRAGLLAEIGESYRQ